ncbi:MAG: hypothetical protein V3V57_02380 [Spirochaetia bacterium]
MINWKIPAGFAAFGALVSLLAGIIGGNPLGVIVLRLVLSAVVCAGLGLIVNVILKKYLPELSATPASVEVETGEEVDIVIDEDIPVEVEALVQEEAGPEGERTEEEAELILDEEGMDGESAEVKVLPGEVETLEPSNEQTLDSTAVPLSPVTDFEDLDTLPDIDQFNPAAEESPTTSKKSRMNAQVEKVVKDQDPENLARAVRTFMKKDQ